jgi:hypothetical protein
MYSLTIVFGPTGTAWRLLFKEKERAEKAFRDTELPDVTILDDFSQSVHITGKMHGVMLENLNESKLGFIEMKLHDLRAQKDAAERIKSDPALAAAIRASQGNQGMPILQPSMGGMPMR